MKYRKTLCSKDYSHLQKPFNGQKWILWGLQPIDMRRKYYTCINCKEQHLVKEIKHLNDN